MRDGDLKEGWDKVVADFASDCRPSGRFAAPTSRPPSATRSSSYDCVPNASGWRVQPSSAQTRGVAAAPACFHGDGHPDGGTSSDRWMSATVSGDSEAEKV